MKKKVKVGVTLLLFVFYIFINFYKVKAYSGEIDPENYIYLPSVISVVNKVGTGTISLSSSISGYSISYQKVDVTQNTFKTVQDKSSELKNYENDSRKTLEEKKENVNKLQEEYQKLSASETATQEEKEVAYNKYKSAYDEYKEFIDTVNSNIEDLRTEIYELIPNYTSSWKSTTNSSNNIELDLSEYTDTIYFALWVKITNGTNTYYDVELYSSEVKSDNTDNTDEEKNPIKEWTNFKNSTFELKKEGVSKAIVQISNVEPKENSKYYLLITSNANKPSSVNVDSENKIILQYDKDKKIFTTTESDKVTSYVELNQELYASVLETNENGDENIVVHGKELKRYAEPTYSDAFSNTYMTNKADQIVTTFTYSGIRNRKIQIKVGKITDKAILQKIKNQDSSGFADLLTFARKNKGIYDEILDSDKDDTFAIEYNSNTTTGRPTIELKGLEDEEYYFLYVKAQDENGKYITQEAVTLAQADVFSEEWFLFFYGTSDFKWADFGDTTVNIDNTIAPGKIPQTGLEVAIVVTIFIMAGIGVFSYIQYRKNNF